MLMAIAAGLTVALSACGGGAAPAGGPLALYTWVSSQSDRQQWESFISEAKKVDPTLDVTIDGPSFEDYWTKVKTRLSGSDTPCLLTTQSARAQELGSLLMPLDDLAKANGYDLSKVDKSMLAGMTVDGTLRAIPYDAEPIVLFYNADSFAKAGIAPPGLTYSREQFIADAKKLTTPDHKALAITPGIFIPAAWATAGDASWLSADKKLNLADPAFVAQVQSYFDLVSKEGIAAAPNPADTSDVFDQQFTSGAVDMMIQGPWMYGTYDEAASFTLGVTVVPSPSGQARGMTAGSGFGIAANCNRPDEAFKAIVALTSTPVQEALATSRGIVPARAEALPAWGKGKVPGAADTVSALLQNATAQVTTPTWNQVETLMTQYGVEGYRGQRSAADIMQTIQNSVGG